MSNREPIFAVHDSADGEVQVVKSVCEDADEGHETEDDESARLSITEPNRGSYIAVYAYNGCRSF